MAHRNARRQENAVGDNLIRMMKFQFHFIFVYLFFFYKFGLMCVFIM